MVLTLSINYNKDNKPRKSYAILTCVECSKNVKTFYEENQQMVVIIVDEIPDTCSPLVVKPAGLSVAKNISSFDISKIEN